MKKENLKRAKMPSAIALLICLAMIFIKPGMQEDIYEQPAAQEDAYTASDTREVSYEETASGKELPDKADKNNAVAFPEYSFRSEKLLNEHFEKHGIEMGFDSKENYLAAANKVIQNPDSLHKLEAEDGDDVYYLEATNEFVIVSADGYIRTYFLPDAGIDYYNRQ